MVNLVGAIQRTCVLVVLFTESTRKMFITHTDSVNSQLKGLDWQICRLPLKSRKYSFNLHCQHTFCYVNKIHLMTIRNDITQTNTFRTVFTMWISTSHGIAIMLKNELPDQKAQRLRSVLRITQCAKRDAPFILSYRRSQDETIQRPS